MISFVLSNLVNKSPKYLQTKRNKSKKKELKEILFEKSNKNYKMIGVRSTKPLGSATMCNGPIECSLKLNNSGLPMSFGISAAIFNDHQIFFFNTEIKHNILCFGSIDGDQKENQHQSRKEAK